MDVVSETRIVVDKCRQDMNGFETRLSDIRFVVQEQWRKKVKIVLLHQILRPKTLALRSNDLCFYTSDGAFICKDCKLYANWPFVVWLEFILLWYNIYDAAKGCSNYDAIFVQCRFILVMYSAESFIGAQRANIR